MVLSTNTKIAAAGSLYVLTNQINWNRKSRSLGTTHKGQGAHSTVLLYLFSKHDNTSVQTDRSTRLREKFAEEFAKCIMIIYLLNYVQMLNNLLSYEFWINWC